MWSNKFTCGKWNMESAFLFLPGSEFTQSFFRKNTWTVVGAEKSGDPLLDSVTVKKIVKLKRNVTKNKIRLCFWRLSYRMWCIKFGIYQLFCQAPYHLIAATSSALPRKALHLWESPRKTRHLEHLSLWIRDVNSYYRNS